MLLGSDDIRIGDARDLEGIRIALALFEIADLKPLTLEKIQTYSEKFSHLNQKPQLLQKIIESCAFIDDQQFKRSALLDTKQTSGLRALQRVDSLLKEHFPELSEETHLSSQIISLVLEEIYETQLCFLYRPSTRAEILGDLIQAHWLDSGIEKESVVEHICSGPRHSHITDEVCQFGRAQPLDRLSVTDTETEAGGFVFTKSVTRNLEKVAMAVQNSEPALLVGETGTGKTTLVQEICKIKGKQLHVFNMSQTTDSVDLLGGFKPVDTKFIIKPIYSLFLKVFKGVFGNKKNQDFLKTTHKFYEKSAGREFVQCLEHGLASIKAKVKKMDTIDAELKQDIADLKQQTKEAGSKLKHAETSFIFKFIEGTLIKSLKTGAWILLDEINLASDEILGRIAAIINSKTLLLNESGEVEPIQIHPEFRLFCCMNPHHSSAGKKKLPRVLREKMTEIFVDEILDLSDLRPFVEGGLSSVPEAAADTHLGLLNFYIDVKKGIEESKIRFGTHKPSIGLRNLCRALKYIRLSVRAFELPRALFEGCVLNFTTQIDEESRTYVIDLLLKHLFQGAKLSKNVMRELNPPTPEHLLIQNYAIAPGQYPQPDNEWEESYILTNTFKKLLSTLCSVVSVTNYAVLIEGPTSAGKTSTIEYLAKRTQNRCIRINNHEHTDIQEYIGSYIPGASGKLHFQEGVLVEAVRNGYWVILDELNLAPSEVLEALNRLLDDNNELFIIETQQTVKAHPNFRIFATQNPTEGYGGRKQLSEAFKNRFIQINARDIPDDELVTIIHKRGKMALSYSKKLINILKDLKYKRQSGSFFSKEGVITVRDLLKWATRHNKTDGGMEALAHEGYLLLAERMRTASEKRFVRDIIEKHTKATIRVDAGDPESYLEKTWTQLASVFELPEEILQEQGLSQVIQTRSLKRLAILVQKCLENQEPVLLVGDTGCGKTTICQLLAMFNKQKLFSINVHQNTETSDFLGSMRTKRDLHVLRAQLAEKLSLSKEASEKEIDEAINKLGKDHPDFKTLKKERAALNQIFEWKDGILVEAMEAGGILLIDEISLASDSVLERLNSVFEKERTLVLAEKASEEAVRVQALDSFGVVSTMNPSGDYGKKELSPALRNRMTEIWVETYFDQTELKNYAAEHPLNGSLIDSATTSILDLYRIIEAKLTPKELTQALFDLVTYYNFKFTKEHTGAKRVSIRDVLNCCNFINSNIVPQKVTAISSSLANNPTLCFIEAAHLIFIDPLGLGVEMSEEKTESMRQQLTDYVYSLFKEAPE